MTIYEAGWVCPASGPPIRNGRLLVDNGRIVDVVASPLPSGESGPIRFPNCAIIPGFVNTHTHLELTVLRGFLEDCSLLEWIPRLMHAKYECLTFQEILTSARLGAIEMLAAGVTCIGEVMDLGVSWQAMQEFGLQGIAYQEVFGPAEDQAAESLSGLRAKIETYRADESETLRAGVSPHAPYTVSARLFRDVNNYAQREGLRLTTHIAESHAEGRFVREGAGIFADRLRERGIAVRASGRSPVDYLDKLGLLRPEMLLAHAVDVDEIDLEVLRLKKPAVAHCPKSNAKLGHGIAPVAGMRAAGILVGLGTDSVASNNVVDMFEEMRSAIFQQRGHTECVDALDAETAFRMATLGGAECLGLDEHLGSLDIGKRADFSIVDLSDPAVRPVYDPIQTMVYSASRLNVRATFVAGQAVQTQSRVEEILRECDRIARKLQLSDVR